MHELNKTHKKASNPKLIHDSLLMLTLVERNTGKYFRGDAGIVEKLELWRSWNRDRKENGEYLCERNEREMREK